MTALPDHLPSLEDIEAAAASLFGRAVATPVLHLIHARLAPFLPNDAQVFMKLELFQHAGSFKSRGVMLAIDALTDEQRQAGVTAVSAGNHALAVSWGAQTAGLSAKVVMPKTADPVRVEGCKALGAEVVLCDDVSAAFAECDRQVREEGRTMLHPFESPHMTLGAATCGLEIARSCPNLDAMIVPIGGGGLSSGIASAFRHVQLDCAVYGVEPFGADSTWRSLQSGQAERLETVSTIADSLGAPMALPQSFAVNQACLSEVVRLEDDALRAGMRRLFDALKIVPEPACAASLAALMGPLRNRLSGKRVGVIACGSNIGPQRFLELAEF